MAATETRWRIQGEYFENCNCDIVCPCLFSPLQPMTSVPSQGACEVGFGFHVNSGNFGDVSLDGLNVGLIARTPGPMADGNWQVALYLDDQADEEQSGALQAIFTGSAGGVMANLAPLIGEVLGARSASIRWHKDGKRRSIEVDDVMALAVHAVPSIDPDGRSGRRTRIRRAGRRRDGRRRRGQHVHGSRAALGQLGQERPLRPDRLVELTFMDGMSMFERAIDLPARPAARRHRRRRCCTRHLDRDRAADARHGRRAGHRPRRARVVRRRLGDDDGGDDAAVGDADGLALPAHIEPRGRGERRLRADLALRRELSARCGPATGSLPTASIAWSSALGSSFLAWDRAGPYVAGGAIALAGLYELTPLKSSVPAAIADSPLHFVLGGWREGSLGAIRMGVEHGAFCVGCCWGLMLVLFALGVMSLLWMVVVADIDLRRRRCSRAASDSPALFAVGFIAAGIWVAVCPGECAGPDAADGLDERPDAADTAAARKSDETLSTSGMRSNRSIPSATVIPVLIYPDVRTAVTWLEEAFGFAERLRIGEDHRSQLSVGEGAVIVGDVRGDRRPPREGEVTHSVTVRVEDVAAHCERARTHGARILMEPTDFDYGERRIRGRGSRRTSLDVFRDARRCRSGHVGRNARHVRGIGRKRRVSDRACALGRRAGGRARLGASACTQRCGPVPARHEDLALAACRPRRAGARRRGRVGDDSG